MGFFFNLKINNINMIKSPIDFEKQKFRKMGGEEIQDITSYINDIVKGGSDVRVIVGCDSNIFSRY